MARIAGVNIPTNKRVEIALTYIHGIGRTKAREITAKLGIPPERRSTEKVPDLRKSPRRSRPAVDSGAPNPYLRPIPPIGRPAAPSCARRLCLFGGYSKALR